MKTYDDQGFASTQLLFLLVFILSLSLGLRLYLQVYSRLEYRSEEKMKTTQDMNVLLALIIKDIESPGDPKINCSDDPVWSWNNKTLEGFTIHVNPISDKLNLNFLGKHFLERSNLHHLFLRGQSPDDLQQFRLIRGLSLSPESYGLFFDPEILDAYFTGYGLANINLLDESTATALAYTLTGSRETAERLRIILQDILLDRNPVSGSSLKSRLGMDYPVLFPYINAEPMMNINFLPPPVLKTLLTYPAYGVSRAEEKYWEILERRSISGISVEELIEILGVSPMNPITGYLGSVTWFWEITITDKGGNLRSILCRIPGNQNRAEPACYKLIEQRYQ